MGDKEFLTTGEAATLFGVTPRTIQLWAENGVLRAVKTPGGHRRFRKAEIEKLLDTPTATPGSDRPVVLVIDDDADLRILFTRQLAVIDPRARVHTASDGYSGMVQIGLLRPDLEFLDVMMPGVDGLRVLKAVRGNNELDRTRVVVVTGLTDAEIADRGGLPDGVEVLRKPVTLSELMAVVRVALAAP